MKGQRAGALAQAQHRIRELAAELEEVRKAEHEQRVDWLYWEGFTGLQEEINEMGPSGDAVGPETDGQFHLRSGDFAIVYGVNHQATGKATYSSLSLYEDNLEIGLGAAYSRDYPGSVARYLEGLPPDNQAVQNADKLYAWKLAWDCEGEENCLPVQNPGCETLDLTDSSPFKIFFPPVRRARDEDRARDSRDLFRPGAGVRAIGCGRR